MPHAPAAGVHARDAILRPTVGGRRAPVTARGRAVLDDTRRRLQSNGLQLDASQVARSTR
ncbi:MAG TPA: hypothetical protein VF066_13195 [Thermoleophilaceae bacterium]